MNDKQYDCLIVGGGISGISFAHYLHQQGKKVLILEQEKTVGGRVQSPLANTDSTYWREMGAHTCYNSYTRLLLIVKQLVAESEVLPLGKGGYKVYAHQKVKSVTTQIQYLPLLLNAPKLFWTSRKGKTVKEYFANIVGKSNYNHLFSRLFRAVLSQNADLYPAESFLKRRDGRFTDFPRKYTFSRGLHTILQLMVEKNKLEVIVDTKVVDIQKSDTHYTAITQQGQRFSAPNIAFGTPPNITAQLTNATHPRLSALLTSIPMFESESMNVIVAKQKLSLQVVAGIIPVSDEFQSAVSRDLVDNKELRSFTFHFAHCAKSQSEKLDLICRVLNIERGHIIESLQTQHTLPSLRLQHLHIAQQVAEAQDNDTIYILGNYFYGLSLEDCVHRSHDEAMRFGALNR